MAAQFPGAGNAIPAVYSEVVTLSNGASIPSGSRLALLMGEGLREERLVSSAVGGGNDGLNSLYTSTNDSDGRHFKLSLFPIIANRTRLFKNGVELSVLEDSIDDDPFNSLFDARVEIETGKIELQRARLVDQGGALFSASSSNVGTGTLTGLTLLDPNAPTETWTIRCNTVRRDGYGDPIDGYALFTVRGSVSGVILDGYGSQIVWQSNGVTVSNEILEFAIEEGLTAFREGDSFTVRVQGGALVRGDSLTARYIASLDINDPEFFTDINVLAQKHGQASLTNRITLGAQLMWANATPGTWTIQTAPSVPRRVSYILEASAAGEDDIEDLTFPLPLNVVPDVDSKINFFLTDPVTGVESQISPNKVDYYDPSITANPSLFSFGAGYTYSYTVILEDSVQKEGSDGDLVASGLTATLSSDSVTFNLDDLSATRSLEIFNATNSDNNGIWTIVSVSSGVVTISRTTGSFVTESGLEFQVLDSSATSARILFTDDLALTLGQTLRATVVDTKDAAFFDAGWLSAFEAAEKIDVDMVVPLPSQTISAIFQIGKAHVETQSNIKNKHERMLFIGGIAGLTPNAVLGIEDVAVEDIGILEGIQGDDVSEILAGDIEDLANYDVQDAFGDSFRVVYFFPDEIVAQVGADRLAIDGMFMAAAAAGFFSATPNINTPLTNKRLAGFTILRSKLYTPGVLESLAASGITVLQPIIGGGRVIWGKTTTLSGFAEEEEISIIFIRDRIAKSMRAAFEGFVGVAETPTFQATLFARALAAAHAFLSQRMITDFKDLIVARDLVEPRQWNVSIRVQPTYPVNWLYVKISVGRF